MCSDLLRLRGGLLALLLVPAAACTNFISGDERYQDELAAFKVRGSVCVATSGGDAGTAAALADSERYRWLSYRPVLLDVVAPSGNVRYATLLEDAELLANARATVEQVAVFRPGNLDRGPDRVAFWINAYNALTLEAAARGYAADPAFRVDENGFAFFDNEVHVVGGRVFSLNQIENGILRGDENHPSVYPLDEERRALLLELHDGLWGGSAADPRFHFVINCASSSCPALLSEPLTADTLDEVMEQATDDFLDDEERGAGPDGISQIFQFYFNDFESEGGIDAFISRYRDLSEVNTGLLLPYDWSLNLATD